MLLRNPMKSMRFKLMFFRRCWLDVDNTTSDPPAFKITRNIVVTDGNGTCNTNGIHLQKLYLRIAKL